MPTCKEDQGHASSASSRSPRSRQPVGVDGAAGEHEPRSRLAQPHQEGCARSSAVVDLRTRHNLGINHRRIDVHDDAEALETCDRCRDVGSLGDLSWLPVSCTRLVVTYARGGSEVAASAGVGVRPLACGRSRRRPTTRATRSRRLTAVVFLGDQVDTGVGAPVARPIRPQPDLSKLAPVLRCVLQVPGTDTLELVAAPSGIGIELGKETGEAQGPDGNPLSFAARVSMACGLPSVAEPLVARQCKATIQRVSMLSTD